MRPVTTGLIANGRSRTLSSNTWDACRVEAHEGCQARGRSLQQWVSWGCQINANLKRARLTHVAGRNVFAASSHAESKPASAMLSHRDGIVLGQCTYRCTISMRCSHQCSSSDRTRALPGNSLRAMSSATLMPNRVLMGTATSARLKVSDSCGQQHDGWV